MPCNLLSNSFCLSIIFFLLFFQSTFSSSLKPMLFMTIPFFVFIHEWNLIDCQSQCDFKVFRPIFPLIILSKSQNSQNFYGKQTFTKTQKYFPVSFMLIQNGKFPLCAWLRPHYLAPAHSHCFSYVKVANISAPETPRQIQRRQDGGSRGKVSLERECRLTLTLGLHFSKRVCVCNYSCPARHFTECLHFWRGLYLPRAWGPTGWVYTTSEHSLTSARTHTNTAGFWVWISDSLSKRRVLS